MKTKTLALAVALALTAGAVDDAEHLSEGRRDGTPRITPLRCTMLPGGDVKFGEQLNVSVVSYPAKWKGKSAFPNGIRSPDADGAIRWDLVKEGHKYGTGETRLWRRDDGSAACSFSVKMSEDLPCSGLVASFTIPAGLFVGSVWRDSKGHAVIAPQKFEKLTLASGSVDWLELEMPNNDVRRLRISFPKARIINLQDDRQWGDTFTLRLYLSASDMLKKGNTYEQTFFVEGPAEIARQPIVRIAPGGDYIPLDFRKAIVPGSALDFSAQGFLDAPAGKYGWLRNAGGHFEYEGRPGVPCRFWGANLAINAVVPSHEGAVLLIDTLARTGYNTIRIHNSERQFLKNSPDYLTLDEEQMEKFDFLFAEGKKRGFVFTTDLFIQRDSNWRALGVDRDGKVPWRDMKTLILVHDGAFENWKAFARNLLLHRNRYTRLTYAEDPAMPLLVLINEGWCEWNGRAFEHEQTRARWKEWLAAKRAADPSAYPAAPEDCKGFRLDQASAASAALRAFAGEMERSFCRRARDYLRSIGVKAMLSDWNCGPIIPEIQSAVSDELDYEDRHFYVDHPVFIRSGGIYSTSRNQSPVLSPRGHPGAGNVFRRVPGRPLTVSEWNHCGPSPYRAVGGLMTGAFAALRDWDILWHFNYAVAETDAQYGQWRFDAFTIATDPWMIAMARMGGLLFMRREISPLPAAEAAEAFDPLSLSGPVRFGRESGREFMTVSTGRTAAGFARDGGTFAAGPLDCRVHGSQATVFASALEGERLEDSPRILLMHLTDLQTEGSSFKDGTYRTLLGWGYHRPLVRKGSAEVSLALARPGECEVWALETDGTRAERVPAKVIGDRLCFTMRVAPPAARIAYEICRVPRK